MDNDSTCNGCDDDLPDQVIACLASQYPAPEPEEITDSLLRDVEWRDDKERAP